MADPVELFDPSVTTRPERINPMVRMFGSGPSKTRCKACKSFRRKTSHGYKYFKCDYRGDTNGPGTDHRANWPTCGKFIQS